VKFVAKGFSLTALVKTWLADVSLFSKLVARRPLRAYQLEIALAIVDSVIHQRGLTFAIMLPRQSGKNETQAQVEAYLLNLFQRVPGAQLVKASPTFKPQTINSLMRLETLLGNAWNAGQWAREQGYIVRLGCARMLFFSAEPSANVVGATASILLECDEAQDVDPAKWQKDFAPMVASTNATRVFWGTAWTSTTLLATTIQALRALEQQDGIKRVFTVSVDQVAAEVPAYGQFVAGEIQRLGREHPLIKTQFLLETIDATGGLFTPARRAAMHGAHAAQDYPTAGAPYAFLIDVGGADEDTQVEAQHVAPADPDGRRDSTALTIVHVDLSTLANPILHAPTYRAVFRLLWTNTAQPELYGQLLALAQTWKPTYIVIDATGLGQGLATFLTRALPGRVVPFVFTSASKSKLGWDFLALIDSGRFQDHAPASVGAQHAAPLPTPLPAPLQTPQRAPDLQALFFSQLIFCQYEVVPGPGKLLKWSVPNGARDPVSGAYLHDDLIMSAALCAVLDSLPWSAGGAGLVHQKDPLLAEKGF
jgi:hypothetical protein